MTNRNKSIVTVALVLSLALTAFSGYIFTTEPGLHYMVILYNTFGMLVFGGISMYIARGFKKHQLLGAVFAVVAILLCLPILIGDVSEDSTRYIGLATAGVGVIAHGWAILKNWKL